MYSRVHVGMYVRMHAYLYLGMHVCVDAGMCACEENQVATNNEESVSLDLQGYVGGQSESYTSKNITTCNELHLKTQNNRSIPFLCSSVLSLSLSLLLYFCWTSFCSYVVPVVHRSQFSFSVKVPTSDYVRK
jgi:hypothetical protein